MSLTRTTAAGLSILALLLAGAACARPGKQSTTNSWPTPTSNRGVSLSPDALTTDGFAQFYSVVNAPLSYISWGGPTSDLERPGGGAQLLLAQAKEHALIPIIIVSPTADNLRDDSEWKLWSDSVVVFAKHSQPPYLGVGNELNKTLSASRWHEFLDHYQLLVSDIHRESPQTKVFTVLQLEWLKGLRGGLFGGKNNEKVAQWEALEALRFGDLIAFSTYPGLIYKAPADIPQTYYSDISQHTDRPVAFTEVGWFRTGPKGWESSADEQADFIERFFPLVNPLHPVFTLWSFVYDPDAPPPFTTMGLLESGQTTGPAWEAWKTIK